MVRSAADMILRSELEEGSKPQKKQSVENHNNQAAAKVMSPPPPVPKRSREYEDQIIEYQPT